MANSQSIGIAYLDQDIIGAQYIFSNEQIGYGTAAQGTVTQLTDKGTGVTLNKSAGQITMNNAALAGNTAITFTLTNNLISARDVVIMNVSGGATAGAYTSYIASIGTGSAVMTLRNLTSGSLSEAVVINYAIIHGQ